MKTAEEILKEYGWNEVIPFNENITIYYPALINAMEEYANQEKEKEAISFYEWFDTFYMHWYMGDGWYHSKSDSQIPAPNRKLYKIEQLYQLYKSKQQK